MTSKSIVFTIVVIGVNLLLLQVSGVNSHPDAVAPVSNSPPAKLQKLNRVPSLKQRVEKVVTEGVTFELQNDAGKTERHISGDIMKVLIGLVLVIVGAWLLLVLHPYLVKVYSQFRDLWKAPNTTEKTTTATPKDTGEV